MSASDHPSLDEQTGSDGGLVSIPVKFEENTSQEASNQPYSAYGGAPGRSAPVAGPQGAAVPPGVDVGPGPGVVKYTAPGSYLAGPVSYQ